MTALPGVSATQVISALKIVSTFDFKGAIAAFEGQDDMVKVDEGLMALEDVAKILGLFVPEAATAAEWIDVLRIAIPLVIQVNAMLPGPHVLQPGEYEAFGQAFNGTLLQGDFTK